MYKTVAIVVLAAAACGLGCGRRADRWHETRQGGGNGPRGGDRSKADRRFQLEQWTAGMVTVNFPKLYEDKPLRELAALTRAAVVKEFKQTPSTILLAFALGAGTTAEAVAPHATNWDVDS